MKNLDFWYFWGVFKSCYKTVVLAGIICALAAYSYNRWVVKPLYQASVTLYFGVIVGAQEQESGSQSEAKSIDSATAVAVGQGLSLGLQLVNDYRELIHTDRIRDKVSQLVTTNAPDLDHRKYTVSVELVKMTRLIKVNVLSESPKLAQVVADAYPVMLSICSRTPEARTSAIDLTLLSWASSSLVSMMVAMAEPTMSSWS